MLTQAPRQTMPKGTRLLRLRSHARTAFVNPSLRLLRLLHVEAQFRHCARVICKITETHDQCMKTSTLASDLECYEAG